MAVSAEPVVRALGLILSNSSVYGTAHAVTRQSAGDCYRTLQQAWLEDDLRISLADDVLTVNQTPVELKNRLARHLADHLAARAITDATLMRDMTQEQFLAFVEVLEAQPEELEQLGGFAGAIASVGLGAVVACRKRVYREITDDQEVVERERLATLKRGGGSQGTGGDASAGGDDAPDAEAESIASLLAWLQGDDDGEASGAAAEAVRDMSGNAPRLAAMIVNAAEARAAADGAPTAWGEAAVEALRRAYAAMTDDPSFHTQKKKKQIQRTLVLLEQELADKLSALNGPADGSLDTLKEAVEDMTDELTVDALAQEYARKRNAIETSERRLVRYVKRKGVDGIEESELKQRLIESGLDEDGWRELLARCLPAVGGTAGTPGDAARTVAVTDDMARLLTRLVSDAVPPAPDASPVSETVLKQDLQPIRQAVEAVVHKALQRIEDLVVEVEGPDGGAGTDREAATPRLTRQRLFEILAELGQELCQPLAVIACSVDMIRGGGLGEVTALQIEMLNAAAESGDKLKTLIDRIIEIAGMPTADAVNKSIQASLYR